MNDEWGDGRQKNLREKNIDGMSKEVERKMYADERKEEYKGMRGDKQYKFKISEGYAARIWIVEREYMKGTPNHLSKILKS